MKTFPPGKLPAEVLAKLLGSLDAAGPEVLLPPGIGADATAIAFGDRCLVAASDPITFATDEVGWYSVMVNANDVACLGADPRWFLATVLLPEKDTNHELVERIFDQVTQACGEVGATLCGGHTEITHGIDRPILSGTMFGDCPRARLVVPSGMQPGDAVIATKGIAIEGTAVLAREAGGRLQGRIDGGLLDRMRGVLHDPGICVVPDARAACSAATVHAMHDVTEGGMATALLELAQAGGCGLEAELDAIDVLPETRALCDALGADPLGLLGSGCLLITVAPDDEGPVLDALDREQIKARVIARALEPGANVLLRTKDGANHPLPSFTRDEVARLLD